MPLPLPPPGDEHIFCWQIRVFTFTRAGLKLPGVHLEIWKPDGTLLVLGDTGLDGVFSYDWFTVDSAVNNFVRVRGEKSGYMPSETFCQVDAGHRTLIANLILLDPPAPPKPPSP